MKPTLQFRLSQHLTLTPQLQQSIRLLQLSTVELNQEIERLLADNPILEREDGESEAAAAQSAAVQEAAARSTGEEPRERIESAPSSELPADFAAGESEAAAAQSAAVQEAAARSTGEEPRERIESAPSSELPADFAAPWRGGDEDGEDGDRTHVAPDNPTLRDHLNGQLALTNLGARDRALVALLIDALDEDGYLTQPLEEITALMPAEAEVECEELAIALRQLQNLEPAGVGARSPGECLCLQMKAMEQDPVRDLALAVAGQHLELLAARDYARLKTLTGV